VKEEEEERPGGGGGLRAPEPTKLISADMLAGLDDEDDIPIAPDPCASSAAIQAVQPEGPSNAKPVGKTKSNKKAGFSANFMDDLNKKLGGGGEDCEDFTDGDEVKSKFTSGLSAPATTQQLTADMLANLDDEDDDIPVVKEAIGGCVEKGLPTDLEDQHHEDDMVVKSGMKAPMCTQIMDPSMLALVDDDDEDVQIQQVMDLAKQLEAKTGQVAAQTGGPSRDQLATLNAAAAALDVQAALRQQEPTSPNVGPLTMSNGNAAKATQAARSADVADGWGQYRAPTSSCKLRLAWLSKDEVRRENEKLRKEIASLRAEIDMHRKEASLARKA
jgi:hypothetical protein